MCAKAMNEALRKIEDLRKSWNESQNYVVKEQVKVPDPEIDELFAIEALEQTRDNMIANYPTRNYPIDISRTNILEL